jgi:hypothetical protein
MKSVSSSDGVARVRENGDANGIRRGIERSFGAAASTASLSVSDFRLAGLGVRLRSPQPDLTFRLARAFGHLAGESHQAPDLVIDLWDSAATGAPPPPMPDIGSETAPGAFFYHAAGSIRVAHQLGARGERDGLILSGEEAPTPALSALDSAGGHAWYWVEDAERIPYWDESAPLRYVFDWWLRDHGIHLVHAGAVGTPHGGAVLVGKGGSGKSTSTLAALQSELDFAGDDYVGVALEPAPWVHSLFSTGKLVPEHAQRLPFLMPALTIDDRRHVKPNALGPAKAVVYAQEHWPERLSAGFPLRAILVPRIRPGLREARIVPVAPSVGLTALAPSTVLQMHVQGGDSLLRMRRLAQTVPCFVLEAGSDIPSIPRAIGELLAGLEQRAAP